MLFRYALMQAERPVTVKQAREILGSISRNYPSSSGQGGMYSMGNAQASPQRFAQVKHWGVKATSILTAVSAGLIREKLWPLLG